MAKRMHQPIHISEAYRTCRRMQRRHDPTFFAATSLLPAGRREATHALYGFFRGADEIVDGPDRPGGADARRAALDAWERALREGAATGRSDHPVLAALVDAAPRHDVPLHLAPRYLRSMRVDCDGEVDLPDDDALDEYMEGSAATVGRLMAPVMGVAPERREHVARLGLAFQLTNFLRDVEEDWALGRRYLPGVDPDQPRSPASLRARRRHADRARRLFALEGPAVARSVPRQARPAVRLACAVYRGHLERAAA